MFCRKCGTEIDTNYRNPDGTIECPGCGAVYTVRSNNTSASSSYREPQSARMGAPVRSSTTRTRNAAPQRRRSSKPGIPKWFLGVVAICAIAAIISIVTASSNPYSEQYKVVSKLEKGFNNRDISTIFECFEPSFVDGMQDIIEATGFDFDTLSSFIFGIDSAYEQGIMNSIKLKIKPLSCEVNGNTATIKLQMKYTASGGYSETTETEADMVQIDGKWYFES